MFHRLSTYNGHVSICDGLNKYKCSGCGMCSTEKRKSYNHMYSCTKKLKCKRCSVAFRDWKSLLNHCKIEHPKVDCKVCHSVFYK